MANQANPPALPTLPREASKYHRWKMDFSSLEDAVGDEMRSYHPFVILSNDELANGFQCFAYAPTTGELAKTGSPKPLLLTVELPYAVTGDQKDSLILPCQLDTMDAATLASRMAVTSGRAHYCGPDLSQDISIVAGTKTTLHQVLLDPVSEYRPRYPIGLNLSIARGSVLELAEYPPGEWDLTSTPAPPPARHTFWVVVSSTLWIHLLSRASKHSAGIAGLIRDVVVVAPLLPGSPQPGENMLAELASPHPAFPAGAFCAYHRLRTRSLQRLVKVHPDIDQESLDDIDTGLRLFFDLD